MRRSGGGPFREKVRRRHGQGGETENLGENFTRLPSALRAAQGPIGGQEREGRR